MKRIKSSFYKLPTLKYAKPKLRKDIISNSDKELINSISECALNVLRGNVNLTDSQKKRLRKYKWRLRTVVNKRVPLARKKRLINQRGGFLISLLSAVLPTIAGFIYNSLKSS